MIKGGKKGNCGQKSGSKIGEFKTLAKRVFRKRLKKKKDIETGVLKNKVKGKEKSWFSINEVDKFL